MKKVSKTEQDIFLQNVHFIYRGLKNSFGCLFISVNLIAVYYGNSTFAEREREREREGILLQIQISLSSVLKSIEAIIHLVSVVNKVKIYKNLRSFGFTYTFIKVLNQ
jgi:hypothetical protein